MHWCILQITYHLSSSARHCTSQHMDAMVRLLHSSPRELLLLKHFSSVICSTLIRWLERLQLRGTISDGTVFPL